MSTVGYGDINPYSNEEYLFTLFLIFFSMIVFAYLLSSIGGIVSNIWRQETEFREKMSKFNNYMQ